MKLLFPALAVLAASAFAQVQTLPTGWRIQPAGKQIPIGAMPASSAVSPDGRYMLAVSDGQVTVIRTGDLTVLSKTPAPGAWKGITFSSDGRMVYVGGGANNRVYEFAFSNQGALALSKEMPVPGWVSDVAIPPGGRLVYATDLFGNRVHVINPQSGLAIDRFATGRRPYQILFHPDGRTYYITAWADGAIVQHDTDSGAEQARLRIGPQPTGMVLSDRPVPEDTTGIRYRLFVTAANTNNVSVIHIDRNKIMSNGDLLNIGFASALPAGMTPVALALSSDQTRLFAACADVNAIAVADISEARSRLAGFLPVGAYPTSVRVLADDRVAVLNGASGTASVIDPITEESLEALTETALGLVSYTGETFDAAGAALSGAIEHVVYIRNESSGANAAKLQSEFAAVTNFVANTPAAVEGFYWSLAGMPPHFTRMFSGKLPLTRFETEPANAPAAGFLWGNAQSARIPTAYFDIFTAAKPELPAELPRLVVMRHTGTDAELGNLIASISNSPAWPKTAIFIEQPNRPLLIVSPYSRGVSVPANGFYNQSCLLRTMQLILKLRPFTLFDGSAPPITAAFKAAPDPQPYTPAP